MNTANSANAYIEDNAGSGSDSDTNSDDSPIYYQPISSQVEDEARISNQVNSNSENGDSRRFNVSGSPPYGYARCLENGVLSLDLSDEEEDSEGEEEEDRTREESDEAVQRAFREDEMRRTAPLSPENANRVMEAMRGISFAGLTPEWAGRIPEDRWIQQLRRMRQSPSANSSVQN